MLPRKGDQGKDRGTLVAGDDFEVQGKAIPQGEYPSSVEGELAVWIVISPDDAVNSGGCFALGVDARVYLLKIPGAVQVIRAQVQAQGERCGAEGEGVHGLFLKMGGRHGVDDMGGRAPVNPEGGEKGFGFVRELGSGDGIPRDLGEYQAPE
jgi:hypothetical protein